MTVPVVVSAVPMVVVVVAMVVVALVVVMTVVVVVTLVMTVVVVRVDVALGVGSGVHSPPFRLTAGPGYGPHATPRPAIPTSAMTCGYAAGVSVRPVSEPVLRAALAEIAEFGTYFELGDAAAEPGPWQGVDTLYDVRSGLLDAVVEATRQRLAHHERRVAASIFQQGFAARLLSPQLGAIGLYGCRPDLTPRHTVWRLRDRHSVALAVSRTRGWQGPAESLVTHALDASVRDHLLPLERALQSITKLPSDLLRGNVASVVVSGFRLLAPRLGEEWRRPARIALDHPYLRGQGTLGDGRAEFVRRSCCLYYRVPGGGLCGDCPLDRRKPAG